MSFLYYFCGLFFCHHIFNSVIVLFFFNDSYNLFFPSSPILLSILVVYLLHLLFISSFSYTISSQNNHNSVNVVFVINDSLIFVAPSAPILLTVHVSFINSFIHYYIHSLDNIMQYIYCLSFFLLYLIITTHQQLNQCSICH